jgi:hypothetical protein
VYLKVGFWSDSQGFLVFQADTKFYQNQTKAHPPDGMMKPYVLLGSTKR